MDAPFSAYGLTLDYRAPSVMDAPHRHSEIEINLIEAGSVVYRFGGSRYRFNGGQMAAFWGATPHQLIETSDDVAYYCLTLPLALCMGWDLPPAFTQRILEGLPIIDPQSDKLLDRALFRRWTADMNGDSASGQQAIMLLELEARLWRMALSSQQSSPQHHPAGVLAGGKAERMAQFIAQHYSDNLTIAQIAQVVHLHPRYAMSVFRATYQMTLLDYLTQYRIAHAQRLLATTNRTILDIAYDAGFNSHSRFYEAFKRICGRSPGAYRRALSAPIDSA